MAVSSIYGLEPRWIELTPLREDLKPGQPTCRAFLLLLPGAAICWHCCSSWCSWGTRANLAAQRCSNLLSRSRGIMLITKSSGSAVAPGLEGLNARGPFKGPS